MTDILRAYLTGFLFWWGASLGCWAFTMIHALTGGTWGEVLQPACRSGRRIIPVFAAFSLPIIFGYRVIFPWAMDPSALGAHARAYYQGGFFIARGLISVSMLCAFPIGLMRAERRAGEKPIAWAASGLIAYFMAMTFLSIDWCMSFTPEWKSTIYGLVWITSQGLTAYALCAWGSAKKLWNLPAKTSRDVGNLLLACVIFWAYLSFMQYLIVWSGNLPREASWYLPRIQPPWIWILLAVFLFQLGAPFFALLFRRVKQSPRLLTAVAVCVVAVRGLDHLWWMVASYGSTAKPIVSAIVAWALFGVLWILLFRRGIARV